MRTSLNMIPLLLLMLSCDLWADCLTGADVAKSTDVTLFEQVSYVNRQALVWRINGKNPYTQNNTFNNLGLKLSGGCSVIDNKLALDYTLYGLTYYSVHTPGKFEEDDHRSRALIDRLSFVYTISESILLEAGKLIAKPGLFLLRSPSALHRAYSASFKSTRLYDPSMAAGYEESPWAAKLSADTRDWSLSLTVVPKLADIDRRYKSAGNWSADQRSNSSEEYLLSYTDNRFGDYTPTFNLMLGDRHSLAMANSYNYSPQLVLNAEVAYHAEQQWRHLSEQNAAKVENYQFPSSLYSTRQKEGVELAVGGQYTSDNFSVLGLEYYFQSEGYSRAQWRKQTDLISFLNTRTGYSVVDRAFDSYKYLMASEISNTGSKGMLQGKHYLNAWASLLSDDQSRLQPYLTVNLMDSSAMLGVHYSTPLNSIDERLEAYTGVFTSQGSSDSEFALFGDTLGVYLGFKYYL